MLKNLLMLLGRRVAEGPGGDVLNPHPAAAERPSGRRQPEGNFRP